MKYLSVLFLVVSICPAFAQQPAPKDQLELCTSQNFIISRYLATDEQLVIQLRSSLTQLQEQVTSLTKQLEEAKAEKK